MCMRSFWVAHKQVFKPFIEIDQGLIQKTALAVFFFARMDLKVLTLLGRRHYITNQRVIKRV